MANRTMVRDSRITEGETWASESLARCYCLSRLTGAPPCPVPKTATRGHTITTPVTRRLEAQLGGTNTLWLRDREQSDLSHEFSKHWRAIVFSPGQCKGNGKFKSVTGSNSTYRRNPRGGFGPHRVSRI